MYVLAQAAGATPIGSSTAETIVFVLAAIVAIGAGIAMITMRNIVHAALMLVVNFGAIALLYLTLEAQFLGVVQIIVYAGAIMVLFLFVIMLLGVDRDDLTAQVGPGNRVLAIVLGAMVASSAIFAFAGVYTGPESACGDQGRQQVLVDTDGDGVPETEQPARVPGDGVACRGLEERINATAEGSIGFVAERLFTRFTFPFELAGLLLTVATVGAMVLGRRNDDKRVAEYLLPVPAQALPDTEADADPPAGPPAGPGAGPDAGPTSDPEAGVV